MSPLDIIKIMLHRSVRPRPPAVIMRVLLPTARPFPRCPLGTNLEMIRIKAEINQKLLSRQMWQARSSWEPRSEVKRRQEFHWTAYS
ncbi:hypothetical protein DAPPUDRAFT_237341 [Daphnia pulex]|uniref:Uncharacterized protein n=1 Tax=Daphnia pulex TaxID=6669 RepID=E9G3N9_DAPPU|nr:hypothetical protein DAPPUDRAFT_237341 [Daphnia pulex]|eukprot:EFX85800.1 hypothetical protein DAPPUDRAFT_237341 [Daphnia pulex]